jgi:hypothetical protein
MKIRRPFPGNRCYVVSRAPMMHIWSAESGLRCPPTAEPPARAASALPSIYLRLVSPSLGTKIQI